MAKVVDPQPNQQFASKGSPRVLPIPERSCAQLLRSAARSWGMGVFFVMGVRFASSPDREVQEAKDLVSDVHLQLRDGTILNQRGYGKIWESQTQSYFEFTTGPKGVGYPSLSPLPFPMSDMTSEDAGYPGAGLVPQRQTGRWLNEHAFDRGGGRAMDTNADIELGASGGPVFARFSNGGVYVVAVVSAEEVDRRKNYCAGGNDIVRLVRQSRA